MEGFALGKIHGEGLRRRGFKEKGFLRYGGFMARARTRMVGGGSCTLRCFCSSWLAVIHGVLLSFWRMRTRTGTSEERGSRTRIEDEDKNDDENADGGELQLHLAVLL